MTTVTQIITDAYRQSNLLAVGAAPTTNQLTEALRYLSRLVKSVFGYEAGEDLTPFPMGSQNVEQPSGYPWWNNTPPGDWFVPKNMRLMLNLDTAVSVYLHPEPDDGSRFGVIDIVGSLDAHPLTIHGNGRNIEDSPSVTISVADTNAEWFYRADLANWVKYTPLEADNTFPFPEEFDDYFITMLAIRLNPSYGIALDQQSSMILSRSRSQLRARYHQNISSRSELGLTRMTKMIADRPYSGYSSYGNESSAVFLRGWPWQ